LICVIRVNLWLILIFSQLLSWVGFGVFVQSHMTHLGGHMSNSYETKTSLFRQLHQGPSILVLPNAWDVASAKIFSALGFPAIATTSSGIANCLGYADGENIPLDEMLLMIRRIVNAVDLPVTADIEAGYANDTGELSNTIASVIGLGVVGINLEDSSASDELIDIDLQTEKLRAVRGVASSLGLELFINARVDVYLLGVGEQEERFRNTIDRAHAYKAAGADCIFIPGVSDERVIGSLVKNIPGPINILAVANTPPTEVLERLGVARVSTGSGPARACATLARRIGRELLDRGTYSNFTQDAMSYKEMNSLFTER
jgi:2-methylisocitrate lyase-like PEP mutase family enzyme